MDPKKCVWLISDDKGRESGPFGYDELQGLYKAKKVNGDSVCFRKGHLFSSGWKPLKHYFPEFLGADHWAVSRSAPSPPAPPPDPEQIRRKRQIGKRNMWTGALIFSAAGIVSLLTLKLAMEGESGGVFVIFGGAMAAGGALFVTGYCQYVGLE